MWEAEICFSSTRARAASPRLPLAHRGACRDPGMPPKRKASAPPGVSSSAERGGASPAGNPKSSVGTADDDERSWSTLAARVRAHGGVVHANVRVGADASGARGLIAIGPIAEGATLFRIPETCTLTAASALRSPLGKAIAARAEAAVEDGTGYHARSRSLPLGDIALAAFVAADSVDPSSPFAAYHALLRRSPLDDAPAWWPRAQRETLLHVCLCKRSTACDCANKVTTRASIVSEATRKDAEDAFEALVRVALVEHVRDRFQNPRRDDQKRSFDGPFDTSDAWDAFRRALAAVHSRAFNFGEGDVPVAGASDASARTRSRDVPESSPDGAREALEREAAGSALVPLLDCANHHRRPRECAWRVSRSREVEVVALRAFVSGDPVRVAYGARSNEHLLTRYGFCVRDNVEPDGSSNDETPFFLSETGRVEVPGDVAISRCRDRAFSARGKHGKRSVFLRVAPRVEYTFAPFADALDLFRARARERRGGGGAGGVDAFSREPLSSAETRAPLARDEEDFLGAFRGDGDGDDDDACAALMYGSGEESGEASGEEGEEYTPRGAGRNESGEDADLVDLEALRDMASSLGDRADALRRAADATSFESLCAPSTRADACVAYFESESRTFRFFSRAAARAAREVSGDFEATEEGTETRPADEDDEGVAALVAAFAELRRRNARLKASIGNERY